MCVCARARARARVCVCVCVLHRQSSLFRCIQLLIAQQVKYVNRNTLSMFKALNKSFK